MANVNFKVSKKQSFSPGGLVTVWNWVEHRMDVSLIVKITDPKNMASNIMDSHVLVLVGEKIKSYFYGELKYLNEEKA